MGANYNRLFWCSLAAWLAMIFLITCDIFPPKIVMVLLTFLMIFFFALKLQSKKKTQNSKTPE